MRVSLATGTLIATTLLTLVGCSNPFWNQFGSKSKSATPSKTALTNAPAPPSFGAQAAVTPAVTMPAAASQAPNTAQASNTSSSFPVYPGTNYPVTPYATPPLASGVAANAPANPAYAPATATPQGAPGGAFNPPSVVNNPNTQPVNPLAVGGQNPPSTPPQYPPFNGPAPPAGPYNAVNPAAPVNR